MKDLTDFIDKVLSLPADIRKELISIAEKNFSSVEFQAYDIYNYIHWRANLPKDHTSSWREIFTEKNPSTK